jgi:chromosome segregation ATPase
MTNLSMILVMQEVFLTWLMNNAPALGFFIFLTWLGWSSRDALAKFQKRIDDRFAAFDGKFAEFDGKFAEFDGKLASFDSKLTSFDSKLARLEKEFSDFKSDFRELIAALKEKKIIKKKALQRNSPIEITELGLTLLRDIGALSYLVRNQDNLIAELEKESPKCALDVETFSISLCRYRSHKDDGFVPIKNFIYLTPKYLNPEKPKDKPIKLDIVFVTHTMGIYLRDRYLEKHRELLPD